MISHARRAFAAGTIVATVAMQAAPMSARADAGTVTIQGIAQFVPRNGDGQPAAMDCRAVQASAFVRTGASMQNYLGGWVTEHHDKIGPSCWFRIEGVPAGVPLLYSVAYGYRSGAEGRWGPFAAGTTQKVIVTVHEAPPVR